MPLAIKLLQFIALIVIMLTIWAIAEFTRSRNANWWLLAGLFAGFALLSKYTAVFLGAGRFFAAVFFRVLADFFAMASSQ